jgi:hypothetical protein
LLARVAIHTRDTELVVWETRASRLFEE